MRKESSEGPLLELSRIESYDSDNDVAKVSNILENKNGDTKEEAGLKDAAKGAGGKREKNYSTDSESSPMKVTKTPNWVSFENKDEESLSEGKVADEGEVIDFNNDDHFSDEGDAGTQVGTPSSSNAFIGGGDVSDINDADKEPQDGSGKSSVCIAFLLDFL